MASPGMTNDRPPISGHPGGTHGEWPPDPWERPRSSLLLVVGAAIVDDLEHPTRLLAARRTEPSALAGGWELPGGKVDPGSRRSTRCTGRCSRSSA